jgi:hypothetical protein
MTAPVPDADELAMIAAGFPAFSIWRSVTAAGRRYVAQSLSLQTHPHTVVTDNLAELTTALTAAATISGNDALTPQGAEPTAGR